MRIGKREFKDEGETYIWGILNVTPDSFSDGGLYEGIDAALKRAGQIVDEGADVIDIGGESTRPGASPVPEDEELSRVIPVIREVRKRFDIPISVDTYKATVAKAALEEGADLINDIWGLKGDKSMADVIARHHAPCCLMHNRQEGAFGNLVEDVISDLKETLALADGAGIPRGSIILDPGIGFAKTPEENLRMIKHADELACLGCPLLIGTSRKSVIGKALDLPAGERLEGTIVTTAFAVWKGIQHVRVHDVKENLRAARMARAILNA